MARPPAYAAFAAMVAPARAHPALWRLGAGMALAVMVHIGFVAGLMGLVWLAGGMRAVDAALSGMGGGGGPRETALLLFSFLGMALGAWMGARALHGRGLRSLVGADPRRAWRDLWRCFAGYGALALAAAVPFVLIAGVEPGLAPGLWLAWLPLAFGLLLVQVGAEEMLFRGYFQTQLAARFRSPVLWLGLPALIFGAAHYAPAQSGGNALAVVAAITLYGLIAGDLTARSGTIGAATGFHLANNTLAILLLSTEGTINGLSLLRTPLRADDPALAPLLLIDAAVMLAGWLICRRLIRPRGGDGARSA